ncbi:hypothetical protein GF359_06905, partial [candidate division WOR-3 bacterium]|nr:hypothetical protein [candidate division WOR-3 bacterium]MBD3364927.1 hypothetical protein [candidate division WOR-3 bacterium]
MDRANLFPDLGEVIYLNHASSGPLPFPAREHMKTLIDDLRFGDLHWDFWLERLSEFRNHASRLLGCEPSEIASTNNTTTG